MHQRLVRILHHAVIGDIDVQRDVRRGDELALRGGGAASAPAPGAQRAVAVADVLPERPPEPPRDLRAPLERLVRRRPGPRVVGVVVRGGRRERDDRGVRGGGVIREIDDADPSRVSRPARATAIGEDRASSSSVRSTTAFAGATGATTASATTGGGDASSSLSLSSTCFRFVRIEDIAAGGDAVLAPARRAARSVTRPVRNERAVGV